MNTQTTTKKIQFIADDQFYADLNEVLNREHAADGPSAVEVRVTPTRTESITRIENVLDEAEKEKEREKRSSAKQQTLRACL
ncbi:hypothetical protein AALP_AA6G081900 [Arabis alpina]|uniref:Uncharacterized protein n=1 Tax=Arabis alpina TaxID=50452 RepID=A0A087GMV3_ARAAL|nr:hypothetical protein AALP_AA6G081900 [Arabis alpina]